MSYAFPNIRFAVVSAIALSFVGAHETRAQAGGAANVTFQWTDRAGGVHALRSTGVVGVEDDSPFGTEPAGTGFTSSATGVFTFTGLDALPFQAQTEYRGQVVGYVGSGLTATAQIQNSGGTLYSQNWPATGTFDVADPPGFGNFTYTVDNTTFAGTAFGMMQAVNFMRNYYVGKGLNAPFLTLRYDGTTDGSFFQKATNTVQIDNNDWASWDVIFHEVGHYFAANNDLDSSAAWGGNHNFGQDLINLAGIDTGTKRAYGEGVGSLLGLMAVKDGNLNASIPGLPAKDINANYDTFLTPLNATSQNETSNVGFNVSAENLTPITGAAGQNLGEGDELSVLRVLWDVFDADADAFGVGSDTLNFTAGGLLALMSTADIFEDFWDRLADASIGDPTKVGLALDATEFEVLGKLGEVLQEYKIGHAPIPVDRVDSTPRLRFLEQNNDHATRHRFVVLDSTRQNIIRELNFADNAGLSNWFWDVDEFLLPGTYYFGALGNSAIDFGASPATDREWYWSSLDQFEVVPEIPSWALACVGMSTIFLLKHRVFGPRVVATR